MDSVNSPSLLESGAGHAGARWRHWALLAGLTALVLLIHGYHPFVEDGGVYAAGIEKLLRPELFPDFTAFTTEHLRFSLFAPMIAEGVRLLHVPLVWVLLLVYCGSVFCTLAAGWNLASRITKSVAGCAGAVALLACAITIPVAGTSLMLTDPYLTARSLSTPLTLFAFAFTLDFLDARTRATRLKALLRIAGCLAAAFALHPLMAAYGLASMLVLVCAALFPSRRRWAALGILLLSALLLAACLQIQSAPDSPLYTWVAMTRYYWFPFRWQWYEQLGLAGPVAVLTLLAYRRTGLPGAVARSGWTLGVLVTVVALCFCRAQAASHLVARLQPLRCFSTVYLLMILLLGAWLGEHWMRHHGWRWALLFVALGSLMFFVERQTFPATAHFELPGMTSRNSWVQAFVWVRDNTPVDAVFALDAHYITSPGEDAQCFRAIAERSALPDYSKDGGEASITPELTPAWVAGQRAQTNLDRASDAQRLAAIGRLGANWMILHTADQTAYACPYRNETVKVCRLP